MLHQEGCLVGHGLLRIVVTHKDLVAILVNNLGDDDRVVVHTIIGNSAVGIHHLEQIDVRRAQSQRRRIVERALDTHLLSSLYDAVNTHLLPQAHGYGVHTSGEGALERH